jgi:transposase
MKTVMGLDIGKAGLAVGICLTELPTNLLNYYHKLDKRTDFYRFKTCGEDVETFLSLGVETIILEPTGGWYSAFWYALCERKGIEVCFISHARLKAQRLHFGFTNKTDPEDALVLAATYFDPHFIHIDGSKRFLKDYNPIESRSIRDTTLEIEQLDKLRNGLVNQLRQRFSFEYPEAADQQWVRSSDGLTPIIKWLCNPTESLDKQRINHYKKSVAHDLGIEISDYSRNQAQQILLTEQQLIQSEQDLRLLLDRPQFKRYNEIFDGYGFGLGMRGLLLYKIFPFEKFLLEDGKPWFVEKTSDDGKIISLDKSQAAFQSYLGLSKRIEQSGDGISTKWNGSTMVRSHLYIWIIATVARTNGRGAYPMRAILGAKWDKLAAKGVKGKDACIRCCYTLTRMLYTELLRSR